MILAPHQGQEPIHLSDHARAVLRRGRRVQNDATGTEMHVEGVDIETLRAWCAWTDARGQHAAWFTAEQIRLPGSAKVGR